ncbi:hypothetical protein Tco_1011479 [Tanacetum coccineum]
MFWHYVSDDFMFTTVKVISKHQDTQVDSAILPQHLTNQAMLESEAYMTYRAYATGEKILKPKTTKKKADSDSSPKTKSTQASKGKRITTLSKGDKPAKNKQSASKSKGLTVLSKVALTEAQQMKIAIERSKIQTHSSHASGSDDDQENVSGETESNNDGDDYVHLNLSIYKTDDLEEEKEEEKANDDEDVSSDQMVSTAPDYEITEEENQEDDDDVMGGEQADEEDEELYGDLNLNLDRRDAEMTDAQNNQETEEVYVTLTTKPPVVQQQSSSVSSDLVSYIINPSPDTALSCIPGIIDNYLASKMEDAVNVVVQLKSNKLREEAQAENDEFLKQIDSNIKTIIKDQVKAQESKIMPKVEKYVTGSLGAEVLARSSNQPQTSYAAAASLLEFELKKILIDKIEENKSMNKSYIQKNLYNILIESYNSDKDLFASYGGVVTLKRGRDDQENDEEPSARSN